MNWRGITFIEQMRSEGISPDETFGPDESQCIRTYNIAWSDRKQAIPAILGYPQRKDGAGHPYIQRITPHFIAEWARSDGRPFMFARKVKVMGMGVPDFNEDQSLGAPTIDTAVSIYGPETVGVYREARLTVTYQTLPFDILEDSETPQDAFNHPDESQWKRYVMRVVRPQGEFFTIPSGSFKYVSDGASVVFGVGKLIVPYNLQITWYEVPESVIPTRMLNPNLTALGAIDKCIGRVNNAEFNTFTAGSILFMALEAKPYRSPFGDRLYDLTYFFKYFKPIAAAKAAACHQHIYRPTANDWVEITTSGATNLVTQTEGKSVYDWGDFDTLFTAV